MTSSLRNLLSEQEIEKELEVRSGWKLTGNKIGKQLSFKDFGSAVDFVSCLVIPSDNLDHHPDIRIVYNQVTLTLFTHDRGGLTKLDFLLADRIDDQLNKL